MHENNRPQAQVTARTLCLIHGWGSNAAIWEPLRERLTGSWELLTVDLPGHGRTPLGPGLTLEAAARRIGAGLPRETLVVGWSLGGLVAIRLARLFPDRVARLALVASNPRFSRCGDWPHAVDPAMLEAFARGLMEDLPGTLRRFLALQVRGSTQPGQSLRRLREALDAGGAPDEAALRQGLSILTSEDLRAELASLTVPVSLLLGERDTIVPAGLGEAMIGLRPDLHLRTVSGAGHAPFLSHPEIFVHWLERWR